MSLRYKLFAVRATGTTLKIESATEAHVEALVSVLLRAFAEFEPLYTREAFEITIVGTAGILARMQEGPVLVGSHAGRVVGTASAVQRESGIYVRGMAVVPEARGIGIGHLLLEEIEAFAKKHSAKRLFLSTTPFLTRAICLYEKFGFRRTDEGPHDLCGTPLFTMEKPLAVVT